MAVERRKRLGQRSLRIEDGRKKKELEEPEK